jgi:hypothetical protein
MKTLIVSSTIALFIFGGWTGAARASQPEFTMVEVEMTPITEAQKPILVSESRFANYELENVASGGQ